LVSCIVGLALGYLLIRIKKLGTIAVGAYLGYVLSLVLYTLFIYKIKSSPPEVIFKF